MEKYNYKTVEEVKDAWTEELWYAWKYYEQGKIDYSDEIADQIAHELTLRGM